MERYKFTFIDVDGNARYQLKHDCKGWAEYGVSYGRETRISNVVKSYTDNYGFIKEDADWLVNMLFSHGPNRRIKFVVERCVDFLAGTYRKEYVGYVDLTQLEIGMGEVTVPICSGGFFKALENKWGDEYEMDVEDMCRINGNIINETAKFVSSDGESGNYNFEYNYFYFVMGCKIKNSDEISDNFFIDTDLTMIVPKYSAPTTGEGAQNHKPTALHDGLCFYSPKCRNVRMMKLSGNIHVVASFLTRETTLESYTGSNHNYGELFLVHKITSDTNDIYLSESEQNLRWIKLDDTSNITSFSRALSQSETSFDLSFSFDKEIENIDTVSQNGNGFMLILKFYGDIYKDNGNSAGRFRSRQGTSFDIKYNKFDLTTSFEAQVNTDKTVCGIIAKNAFRHLIEGINDGKYNVNIDTTAFNEIADGDLLASANSLQDRRGMFHYLIDIYNGGFVQGTFLRDGNRVYLKPVVSNNITGCIWYINGHKTNVTTTYIDLDLSGNPFITCELFGVNISGLPSHVMMYEGVLPEGMQFGTQVTYRGAVLKGSVRTSLNSFLEYCYSIYNYRLCVNYNIENDQYTVFLAHYDDMFSSNIITSLGERINDFSLTLWRDKLYTHIKIGHEVDEDTVNKEREFNCLYEYDTPNTQIEENELSIICPYKAYSRAVEEYLIENFDSDKDGDVGSIYLIHGKPDSRNEIIGCDVYVLNRDIVVSGGSPFPSYEWNVKYWPKFMLTAHARELNGYLAFEVGKMITFKSADYNSKLAVRNPDVLWAEGGVGMYIRGYEDIEITDDRRFVPLIVSISAAGKEWLIRNIENNRTGLVKFDYEGRQYKGYLAYENDAVTINPMNEQQCEFKLLLKEY